MRDGQAKRIEIVNSLINYLGDHEKDFFKSKHKIGEFKHDGKTYGSLMDLQM